MINRNVKMRPEPTLEELEGNFDLMGALRRLRADPTSVIQDALIIDELDRLNLVRPVGVGRVITPKGEKLLADAKAPASGRTRH